MASKRNPIRTWRGPERPYDLVFEGTVAVVVMVIVIVVAAVLWGSPDAGLTYPKGPPSHPGEAFSAR